MNIDFHSYMQYLFTTLLILVLMPLSKIRLRFWIVNIHRMVKSIIYKCVPCRIRRKETIMQVRGKLPTDRLKPSPAWYSTALDYFGPYEIKGEVNKRCERKCYGVLFHCLLTRAIYIDIAPDYPTNSFLIVMRRFITLHGYPSKMYSDNGSQLSAASKEIKLILSKLDWKELVLFGAENGLDWSFAAPDAPWQNGCMEALIKSFSELQTVMFEVANLMNERPIGHHPSDPSEGSYLCPNNPLLGRASHKVPSGPFKEPTSIKHRHETIQQIVNSYSKKMVQQYFPLLIVRQKWHVKRRNVEIGDVAMLQD